MVGFFAPSPLGLVLGLRAVYLKLAGGRGPLFAPLRAATGVAPQQVKGAQPKNWDKFFFLDQLKFLFSIKYELYFCLKQMSLTELTPLLFSRRGAAGGVVN
ncbi:hypothetical protein DP923_01845 [Pontibacter arcticus]|uniref:Uncharacterized protein n=1 Tax=Pontibacter arcticus TaxID=2080288 RepID=A0A364RHS1_9BACT|nr:hypothetical protein DP923_01845 [Pontibacter arcticus]